MNKVNPPLLSICIPTYNRAADLELQILRVFEGIKNNPEKIEIIVLNNASPDNTIEVMDKYLGQSGIQVINNEVNIGLAGNYLKAIQMATGKFVWVLGDDDPFEPSLIGKIVNILTSHKELNVLHLNHKCIEGNTGEVLHEKYYHFAKDFFKENGTDWVNENISNYPIGGLMFISANIFNRDHAMNVISLLNAREKKMQAVPLFVIISLCTTGPVYYVSEVSVISVFSKSSWIAQAIQIQCYEVPYFLVKSQKSGLKAATIKRAINTQMEKTFNPLYFFYHLFIFGIKKAIEYNSINMKKVLWKNYFMFKLKHDVN